MKPVILADLQDVTKAGMLYFLQSFKGLDQLLEADSKKELLQLLAKEEQALIVLDYTLFDFTGLEDLINIGYRYKSIHWLLFSDELSATFIHQVATQSKNISVLFKDCDKEELLEALNASIKGERYLCRKALNLISGTPVQTPTNSAEHQLTTSEKEILRLIAMGKSNKEIATERFSSIHTITTHRKNIFRKLEVNSVYDATKYALRAGILDSAEYYI